jgi:predicted house-cleaning noncanonical NTP pyrophosphatase (MazG superfamily)
MKYLKEIIMELENYNDVIKYLDSKKNRPINLLMGNGFSQSYDNDIFSYKALNDYVVRADNKIMEKMFETVKNKDFEVLMQELDLVINLAEIFESNEEFIDKVKFSKGSLQTALIDAVKELHPDYVFNISPERSKKCAEFLNGFVQRKGNLFTTNYDLLMYWVLMRNEVKDICDGFGRDKENCDDEFVSEEEVSYSELRWGKYKSRQNIFYLHGGLPLFDTGINIVKEEYDGENHLLEKIKGRCKNQNYPIFVTAGNGDDKLKHIKHNTYLSFCYDKLSTIEGSLITFGFNFGDSDQHIIDAINLATHPRGDNFQKLWSIYIGVYSKADEEHIKCIEDKFKCKVHIFDAKTAEIWD